MGDNWPNGTDPSGKNFGSTMANIDAFVALGGVGYVGASLESNGHWNVKNWNKTWLKGLQLQGN
jgi:hypothetical protein